MRGSYDTSIYNTGIGRAIGHRLLLLLRITIDVGAVQARTVALLAMTALFIDTNATDNNSDTQSH